ncbi:MAG: zinc ribbon domain-containing protein [Candidatus Accumulibacter sp.]|nr:zinc ribbon domain-containing protein [Accumulibacter sp.]
MPIYAYRCETCGFEKDHLQKLSDPTLSVCPECGQDSYRKQVTAAGFQLKGNGWYVTDFKGGNKAAPNAAKKTEKTDNGTAETDTTAKTSASSVAGETSAATAAPASPKANAASQEKG